MRLKMTDIDKDGWVRCPICGNKTRTKVHSDTILVRFPLFCPKCRRESVISIANNRISKEPDAKTQSQ